MRHFWVDRIVEIEPGARATGIKAVALSEDVFTDHFPGNPVFPGVYVIEGLAQTAGHLLHESTDRQKFAVMTAVDRARFAAFARPGDTLHLDVAVERRTDDYARVLGEARVGERRIAAARLTFHLRPIADVVAGEYLPFWRGTHALWRGEFPGERAR